MNNTTEQSGNIRIALTPGEPAGIGPELVVKVAQHALPYQLIAVADPVLLDQAAKTLGLPLKIIETDLLESANIPPAGRLCVYPIKLATSVCPGKLNSKNAHYVLETLKTAAQFCLQKKCQALVTGPVQKSIINEAGIPFSGHTEFFAEQSLTPRVVMMLATGTLRVALATTHLPLRHVADAISQENLSEILDILLSELKHKFGLNEPRVLVCGLNPHAGENGHLGSEEIDIIEPVLSSYRARGHKIIGPLPADTLFTAHHLDKADAVLAMYHDQGLPVVKHKGFGNAVNITLGLPFIRTSVDHGTALDLAGKGCANEGSLQAALNQAYKLALKTDG